MPEGTAVPKSAKTNPLLFLISRESLVFKSSLSRRDFHRFVLEHPDLRIERDQHGTITIYPPMTFDSGYYEGEVFGRLRDWSKTNRLGKVFSPSTSFDMPDGAQYKADGAWLTLEKINSLSLAERKSIPVIVPDFVIEVRSQSDRLAKLKKKMTDGWMANGVQLAWLIDPIRENVWIYRLGEAPEVLSGFNRTLSGEAVLPDFKLNLADLKEA
jgi:Uma2 family endonuclease